MFKRILVPVDGSNTASRGLKTAIALAKDQKAVLLVLHVVDKRVTALNPQMGPWIEDAIVQMQADGRKILDTAERQARKAGISAKLVTTETMGISVADAILREAKRARADLLVLGTHGRRGATRLLMGSDAEEVMREATVPVMLIRSPAPRKKKN